MSILDIQCVLVSFTAAFTSLLDIYRARGFVLFLSSRLSSYPSTLSLLSSSTSSKKIRSSLASLRFLRSFRFFLPQALFFARVRKNSPLIRDAHKLQTSLYSIVSSNSTPLAIHFPLVGNNTRLASLSIYTAYFSFLLSFFIRSEIAHLNLLKTENITFLADSYVSSSRNNTSHI